MSVYEIEIKCLLGDKERANELVDTMCKLHSNTKLIDQNSQLNHYFEGGDIQKLFNVVCTLCDEEKQKRLKKVITEGSHFSIRSRKIGEEIRFVIKASINDHTSANGVARIEFDEKVDVENLEALDRCILDVGFVYQAKWSRERKEYVCKGVNVCIDKNAGYGYIAEFEKIIDEKEYVSDAEKEVRALMEVLGATELTQDRLERMFEFYNQNWSEYYGTEKVFTIE